MTNWWEWKQQVLGQALEEYQRIPKEIRRKIYKKRYKPPDAGSAHVYQTPCGRRIRNTAMPQFAEVIHGRPIYYHRPRDCVACSLYSEDLYERCLEHASTYNWQGWRIMR